MFNQYCGEGVTLSDNSRTAEWTGYGSLVLMSGQPLTCGQPFMVEVQDTCYGDPVELCLGVTSQDPDTRSELPQWACDMKDSWCVWGPNTWQDGEKTGRWGGDLEVSPGDTVWVVWDGQAVSIIMNGITTQVFTNVPGPVWALTDVYQWGVSKMSVVRPGPLTQSMGACGGVTPRRTSSITCPYWQVCDRFIDSLGLPDIYFDTQFDCCYCIGCLTARGDNLYYTRGVPPKVYGLPGGWCRFGLSFPAKAHGMNTFTQWHVAYHGTIPQNIQTIIESDLLMPGDYTAEGKLLAPPPGHFTETRKPAGFDIKQVFVSPSITYAGHPAYSKPQRWTDPKTGKVYDIQVALQLRIKPDAYQVGKETLALGSKKIDAKFDNSELEWSTKLRGVTILQGILVKYF